MSDTELSSSGELVWQDCSTFTVMGSRSAARQPRAEVAPCDQGKADLWTTLAEWQLGSEVGRRFAAINGGEMISTSDYDARCLALAYSCTPGFASNMNGCPGECH